MTKREREKIAEAIAYIHTDQEDGGDYDKGMRILCKLIGRPIIDVGVKTISIAEALRGSTKEFDRRTQKAK